MNLDYQLQCISWVKQERKLRVERIQSNKINTVEIKLQRQKVITGTVAAMSLVYGEVGVLEGSKLITAFAKQQ